MKKLLFKAEEKVRVKTREEFKRDMPQYFRYVSSTLFDVNKDSVFATSMNRYCGEILTVATDCLEQDSYIIRIKDAPFQWNPWMVAKLTTPKGNKII